MLPLTGKTILVTGATDGIGRQTALDLAALGATVVVHGRSEEKVRAVLELLPTPAGKHATVTAELASLTQVRRMADEVRRRFTRLDVLLHNAGVFMKKRVETEDGLETTFAVNHLAPFLLTHLLSELLHASAPARVITVSSVAHTRGRMHWDDLNLKQGYEGYVAYAQSKLANVLFSGALAARWDPVKVTSNALHPGVINTKLLDAGFGRVGTDDLRAGAATSVHLASSPQLQGVTGKYFSNGVESALSPSARDVRSQQALWEQSERMVGISRG
ncbi:MAG: SDR family NAD(P)-dependent oxidoreductase [Myxococcota bacterium]